MTFCVLRKLRQVLFDVQEGYSHLTKNLSVKSNQALNQDKNLHRDLLYLPFSPSFSDLNTPNWFFLIIEISYILEAVYFFAKVLTNIFIFHIISNHKEQLICRQFDSVACCV